jgi:predicted nucleotidyltransferase
MKKSLAHLPQLKADELELIAMKIRSLAEDVHMVVLFGSYARGDWKDGPHEQGRGRLIIHKRSDYDILVLVANEYTARDISLWDKVKDKLAQSNLSTHVRRFRQFQTKQWPVLLHRNLRTGNHPVRLRQVQT